VRRSRLRDQSEAIGRAEALRAVVLAAAGEPGPEGEPPLSPRERQLLARPREDWDEQDAADAAWRGEALGALAWALSLEEALPPYDAPFDHAGLARELDLEEARLRPFEEIDAARETARLWHWRARTALLQEQGTLPLPERWSSYDQLVAAAAMRGFEQGLLPAPLRGDFPAFGKIYRHLAGDQRALAHSVAAERHYALTWLCDTSAWDEVATDT
jgi:hypothetical protein